MSEPVDEVDAVLYRELDDIDGTLKGRCRGSVLPLAAEFCDGLEAAEYCDGSLVVWLCSGRICPGLGLLKR